MTTILIHTQYYPPETGAPQARLSELAVGLKDKGFTVTILTAMPSYPQGKIFSGYGGLRKKETVDGILVIRTWVVPTQKTALLPRLINYFSFVFSSLFLGIWGLGKLDYILTESPPLFLGMAGFLLSRFKRAKWIFNISDLWPESAVRLGVIKPGLALTLSEILEAFLYRQAWLVTGQSHEIITNINQRFPIVKTFHLSNGVNSCNFSPEVAPQQNIKNLSFDGELVCFYGGLHGIAQGLDQVIYAAKSFPVGVKFIFVGDGPEKHYLQQLAGDLKLNNTIFMEPVPKNKMPGFLASIDVAIVPLKIRLPGAVPSKLYEAMASGKPVLLIAEGEAADIVQGAECGLVISPGNVDELIQGIEFFRTHPKQGIDFGQNGRKAVLKKYDRAYIIEQFTGLIVLDQGNDVES